MEPLQTLQDFYTATSSDTQITTTHVAVYVSMIYVWTIQKTNPIQITRRQIMKLSQVRGIATYQKVIKDLQNKYILYVPSFNPAGKTTVAFRDFIE